MRQEYAEMLPNDSDVSADLLEKQRMIQKLQGQIEVLL